MTLTNSAACASHEKVLGPRELSSDAYSSILAVFGTRHRSRGETEMASRTAARSPPPTRAGGQDDGNYTISLKLQSDASRTCALLAGGCRTPGGEEDTEGKKGRITCYWRPVTMYHAVYSMTPGPATADKNEKIERSMPFDMFGCAALGELLIG